MTLPLTARLGLPLDNFRSLTRLKAADVSFTTMKLEISKIHDRRQRPCAAVVLGVKV